MSVKSPGAQVESRQTALILGATSSVALELAQLLSKDGYDLVLAARSSGRLVPLQQDLQIRFNNQVSVIEFDAEDTSRHSAFYASLKSPHVAVCLFGLLGDQHEAERDWNKAQRLLTVNFTGAVSILNIIARDFEARGAGTIVGVSSVAGDRGRQSNYIYGSAKAGFTAYLSGLRNQLSHRGVHVATIVPGFISSKMIRHLKTPKILTATPKQVAVAIMKAIHRKRNVVYILASWRWIMLIIRLVPEAIFKRLKL